MEEKFVWPELMNPWKKASKSFRCAFLSACFFGTLTHLYMLTNLLLNHDSVWRIFYDNNNLTLGRWSLKFLSEFSTRFQLPVVIGFLSVLALALAAGLTVSVLEISNKTIAVLTGAFIVTMPSVACIFSYMYTADAYFICLFLNALAVYLTKKYRFGWIPAVALCSIACGGYQAFVCYAIGMFLMDCILNLVEDIPVEKTIFKGLKYILVIGASLVLYYVVLFAILMVKGQTLASYQGLDSISSIQIKDLLVQIPNAYYKFGQYFKAIPASNGIFQRIQVVFLFLALGALAYLTVVYKIYRQWLRLVLLAVGVGLLPLALNFITVLSMGAWVHALMIYSFVLLDVMTLCLIERVIKHMIENDRSYWLIPFLSSTLLAIILVWNNFCVSNIAYLRLQVSYENSYATANRIVARIEALDGYSSDMPVAIVGEIHGSGYGGTISQFSSFNNLTGTNDALMYNVEPHRRTRRFIQDYIGIQMPYPSKEQLKELNESQVVEDMPCYPADGSIAIQSGIVVVKLNNGTVR